MKYGDEGEAVRALQRALLDRGFALPRFGADGDFGQETRVALQRFAALRRVAWNPDDPVPSALLIELGLVDTPVDVRPPLEPLEPFDLDGVEVYDLRKEQADPHPKSKLDARGRTVRRAASAIDSIVLHQAAVRFAAADQHKLVRRSLRVACHAMAFHDGFVGWPVDPLWYVYHADILNRRSLGLEIDGNYPGLIGGTVSAEPETPLTDAVVSAARAGVKLLVEEGRRAGCPIRYIYAHRQTDSWRRADPGEGLWRRVVLEYAVPVLGLLPQQRRSFSHPKGRLRKGKPVPKRWDPEGAGDY